MKHVTPCRATLAIRTRIMRIMTRMSPCTILLSKMRLRYRAMSTLIARLSFHFVMSTEHPLASGMVFVRCATSVNIIMMVPMALVAHAERDIRPLRITRIISQNAIRMMIVEMASMELVDHVEKDIQRWKKDHARMRECSLDSPSLGYSLLDRGMMMILSREWWMRSEKRVKRINRE